MIKAVRARGARSIFLKFLESLARRLHRDAVLAAIAATIAWGPLMRKRISRLTARTLPWYLRLYGVLIGASIPGRAAPARVALRHPAPGAVREPGPWRTSPSSP